ncbi:MAG TPA: hypothetical protein VJH95_02695, partial [Candidatus Nanoarchaeia archaeon]|nr:hypothetical protein [Candidatus Nanoarchaeia archaeon]
MLSERLEGKMSEAGSLEREENELIDVLNYVLRERGYNNLKVANREGKQRIVIAGDWGINGNTMKRWIKVDRIPEGENAGRLAAKGYATERDIGVLLGIKEPEKHYLTKVVDFIDLGMFGYGLASGEDDFSGCSSLSNYTAKNGPLSQKEWLDLVSQGLIAERYLIEGTGLFHKDVKPGNFLVRGVDGGLEIRLTDFVIAGKIKDARESLLPSFGGHIVTDPLLMGCFTGKRRAYGEDSEIYSFGNTLLYALLGRFCFDYNSFNKTAVSCKGGEDLLRDGMLDADRHKRVFKKELKELPRWARIYREMLTKCLTLEESERYGSFRELQADFENVLNPGFFGRLRYSLGAKIGSGVLVAGLGVGGFFFDRYFGKTADLASKEEERISCFGSEWNGRDLGIGNNYMVAKVSAHLKGNY